MVHILKYGEVTWNDTKSTVDILPHRYGRSVTTVNGPKSLSYLHISNRHTDRVSFENYLNQ